jgi:hypothetical protein
MTLTDLCRKLSFSRSKDAIHAKLQKLMLENIFQDLRYSARMLWKNPGFTLVAVLTLALGIGANTAIFSIIDVLLFRPLPVMKPDQLVRIFSGETRGNAGWGFISLPECQEYRDQSAVFSGLAAYVDRFPANVSAGKFGTERVDAGMVTGNYFPLLGASAELGRTLLAGDDQKGAAPVVMLGHQFWKRHFPSDSSVLGSQILIDGQWFTVVGVTPAGFGGVSFENFPQIWIPLSHGVQIDPLLRSQIPQNRKSFVPFAVVGRLKTGISAVQAQAQMDILAERLGAGKPDASEGPDWKRACPVLVPVTQAARQGNSHFSFCCSESLCWCLDSLRGCCRPHAGQSGDAPKGNRCASCPGRLAAADHDAASLGSPADLLVGVCPGLHVCQLGYSIDRSHRSAGP